MRAVLTGLSESGHPTNSPMESRLAAIPLGIKQPKTRLRVGTKKPVRSLVNSLSLRLVQKIPVRAAPVLVRAFCHAQSGPLDQLQIPISIPPPSCPSAAQNYVETLLR